MVERGVTVAEVQLVIEQGRASDARPPRLGREMVFTEGYDWKGRHYPHKLVRVIFAEDDDEVVVVTVYSYFGIWEVLR